MTEPKTILNGNTLIPLGVIGGLLAGAFSYGAMWQQVQTIAARQELMDKKIDLLLSKNQVGLIQSSPYARDNP